MKRNGNISFSPNGTEESVKKAMRYFAADTALKTISRESALLFKGKYDTPFFRTVRQIPIIVRDEKHRTKSVNVWITGWALLDLAFHIITYSNDYRDRELESSQELALLVKISQAYLEMREHDWIKERKYGQSFLVYVYGLMGEQLKFQSVSKCLDNAARELYILFEIAPQLSCGINVAKVIEQETGMTWDKVITFLFLAWFVSTITPSVLNIESKFRWLPDFSYQDYCSIIEHYTSSYQEIREDEKALGRQQLIVKPFIRTQKGEVISINAFQSLFLYEHSIFWIVRDHFYRIGREDFTRVFGEYFELYFKELLEQYVESSLFERLLPDNNQKRADWKMELCGFKFLVEQKSTVLSLFAKQQESDVRRITTFCENYLLKAMRQLSRTEEEYNDGKHIKIILLYEDYLQAEILDEVFKFPSCDVIDDNNYWLMTINEMEMLLKLYQDNPVTFKALIKEKIARESNKSNEGRSIEQLLSIFGIEKNYHLAQERFIRYKDKARKNVESLCEKENNNQQPFSTINPYQHTSQ